MIFSDIQIVLGATLIALIMIVAMELYSHIIYHQKIDWWLIVNVTIFTLAASLIIIYGLMPHFLPILNF